MCWTTDMTLDVPSIHRDREVFTEMRRLTLEEMQTMFRDSDPEE